MSNHPNRSRHTWSESIAHDAGVYTVDDGTVAHGYSGPYTDAEQILDQYVSTYRAAGDWHGNVDLTLRRDGEVVATRAITV